MTDNIISLKDISFSYENKPVFKNFSLDIVKNDIFIIMGVNGCGKTTLLKIICAFLKPDSGDVKVENKSIYHYDFKGLSKKIAYVSQSVESNSDFLVKDYLAFGRTPYKNFCSLLNENDYLVVEKYATQLKIEHLLDKDFNNLSGGEKQIVAICRALVQETPIVIFDEPMSSLDLGKQVEFLELVIKLRAEGKTVIFTSHNPNHALALHDKCRVCLFNKYMEPIIGRGQEILNKENINSIFGRKLKVDLLNKTISFNLAN